MGSESLSAIMEARKVLEDYKLNQLPIDVEGLCDSLGITINYVDFSAIEGKVGQEISGAIKKNGET